MHHSTDQRSDEGTNISSVHTSVALVELSIIEELDLKFGSAKNKHQIMHALEHSTILHRIPLPTPATTSDQARKDFRRERVLLNDVPFIPDKVDVDRCNAFASTLHVLLERMMRRPELYDAEIYCDAEAVSDAVLQRACRTGAGADSFFMVQKLLCVEGTFVTQRAFLSDPPIKIDVFVVDPEPEFDNSTFSNQKLPTAPSHPSGGRRMTTDGIAVARSESMDSSAVDGNGNDRGGPPIIDHQDITTNMNNSINSSTHGRSISSPPEPSTPPPSAPSSLSTHSSCLHRSGKQEKPQQHHRMMPSPLKLSLKNLGFSNKQNHKHPQPTTSGGVQNSPLSPPSTPSPASTSGQSFFSGSADSSSAVKGAPGAGGSAGGPVGGAVGGGAGAICARVQVMNCFAIYDVSAIEDITGVASQDPDPWLEVEAIVVDESNFKTDRHWRKLQLIATCPATGKVYTSSQDASNNVRVSGRLSGRMILQELTSWFTSLPHPHMHSSHHNHSHHNHPHAPHSNTSSTNNNMFPAAPPSIQRNTSGDGGDGGGGGGVSGGDGKIDIDGHQRHNNSNSSLSVPAVSSVEGAINSNNSSHEHGLEVVSNSSSSSVGVSSNASLSVPGSLALPIPTAASGASLSEQVSSASPTTTTTTSIGTPVSVSNALGTMEPSTTLSDSSIPYTPTAATTGRSDSSSALLGLSVVVPPAPGGSSALRNTSTMSAHPAALPAGVGLSSPPYSSGSGGASTAGQRQLQQSRHLSARSYGSNGSSGATSGEDGAGSTSAPETAPEESEQPPLQQGGKVDSAEVRHQALHRAALAALQATTPTSTTSSSRGQHPSAQSFSGPSPSQQEQELGSQQSRPVPVFAKRAHLPHHDSDDSDASDTELQYETERYTGSTDHDTGGTGVGSVHDSVRSAAASLASPAPIYGATVSSAGPAQVQLRTHEELDLLIPALRSMGGGAAGANSSDSEEESSSSLGDMGSTVGSTVGSALGSVAGSTAGSVASAAATRAPSIAGDSDV